MQSHIRTNAGFSMVEALVALVVLSVGMLGIAGLYVTTLRSSGSAIWRMQAVNLANDIGDRIRANRLAGTAYDTGLTAPANNGCVGGGTNCTRAQMAAEDLLVWINQINATLPGNPTGTIVVVPGAASNAQGLRDPSTYTITITWSERDEGNLSHVLVLQV
jgi:type IV pilus assembly protein PilV